MRAKVAVLAVAVFLVGSSARSADFTPTALRVECESSNHSFCSGYILAVSTTANELVPGASCPAGATAGALRLAFLHATAERPILLNQTTVLAVFVALVAEGFCTYQDPSPVVIH